MLDWTFCSTISRGDLIYGPVLQTEIERSWACDHKSSFRDAIKWTSNVPIDQSFFATRQNENRVAAAAENPGTNQSIVVKNKKFQQKEYNQYC